MRQMFAWLLLAGLLLAGCVQAGVRTVHVKTAAVYLAPKEGVALMGDDLAAHPEVVVVRDVDALKAADAPQVWIDAACLDTADSKWLLSLDGVPVTVTGYGDSLYAFAERLDFPVEKPAGVVADPDKPGFCVWLQELDANGDVVSQTMRGSSGLSVQAILDACSDMLNE